MSFSKIRKSLPAATILAVLLLGGAATDAAAFSVDVDSLYYNDASGHNLEYFSEDGYVVDNVLKNGVSPNSYTDFITYDWGVPPLYTGDLTLLLDKSYQTKNFPFARLSTALRGRAALSWSGVPGEAPAVNLDNHIQLYTVKLANFADLDQGGDSAVIIGLGRDDLPSSYQAAVRITWAPGDIAGTYDLTTQAVVKNDQGEFWSSVPITHPGLVLSDPAATPAETTMTVTLSVDSPNNFTAAVWIYSPLFDSGDEPDTFFCPTPVPGQIYRSPDFLSFVDLETANAGTIQLSASSYSVSENYGSVTITATRRGGNKGAVGVSYATSNGTALAGSDYTARSGTLSWADGDTENKTFTVPITNDGIEPPETFTVALSAPTGGAALGAPASATVTIITPTVQFQSGSSSGVEGHTPALFTVILPAPSVATVTVDYTTANGTATAGSDYTATSGTLTFAPGQASKTINVPIINDTVVEGSETFTLTLSNPSNAILGTPAIHTYTIGEPTVQFQSGPSAGPEWETPAVFIVTLSAESEQTVTVNYATANGTATSPWDYTAQSGTLTFNPGQTSKAIQVPIVNDIIYKEPGSRTFTVTLSSPSGGGVTLGTPASKTVTIIDDDPKPPTVKFQSGSSSGNKATTPAVFTVTLSAPPTLTVTVSYATADGTATAGSDYTSTSGVLTFIPGFPNQTSQTIAVPILPGAVGGTFTVTLLAAASATLGTPTIHTYTITEPTVQFQSGASSGVKGLTPAVFTVILPAPSVAMVTVNYATADGTATAGSDYTSTSGTLTFAPGQTSKTITVPIINDPAAEGSETFTVTLSNPSNAILGIPTIHTYTIVEQVIPTTGSRILPLLFLLLLDD